MSTDQIVIAGGGHAAAALCVGLAEAGQGGRVHLVSAENELPYQRPPLSKSFLKNADETVAPHKAAAWYAEQGIQVHLSDPVDSIDRKVGQVLLRSGTVLAYQHLVLATGTRARTLDALPPGLSNVHVLRDAEHARSLRTRLGETVAAGRRFTVLGGGFIGLELAASARQLGLEVTVLEVTPRLLGRSVSASLSEHVLAHHRSMGTEVQIGVRIEGFELQEDRLLSMQVNGNRVAVDELLLGIGAVPETRLAADCGLAVDNGIVVDACMRTSDPAVLAIGDCAAFPTTGGARIRLESVQNANDQARTAAATLLGRDEPYRSLPWFWSEQGPMRLQMAGLLPTSQETIRRAGASASSFTLFHLHEGRLLCAESVNAPLDHMMSRKLIEAGGLVNAASLADPSVPLKSMLA
ncbi:NAD(P)/FAD-dependent oxidoreductase [Hydrogenophaga sp. IBVHS1]|jgi:3-phenylpropionate/trans-cinnamate dioxygenase ferredoxin reductase subunit|uniref:NAD(P)/FAD-dependent oxidoreductase n=1 Tax=unclassified Hydrogenophaga TaxID=2610897 RepID=UPI000A2E29A8|nr:FAD-dependent oxidoreductase [Hydrogenophaga sp. IBVHS1]OSZ71455.1 ferredoxin reductase [Hydrogenophaga sp. IBVHS1]